MKLPELNSVARSADYNIEFKGINHNLFVGENNFYDTYNLCATNYPVMTPRAARAVKTTLSAPQGLFARGDLYWANNKKLYKNGTQVSGVSLSAGAKTFVGMGAYIVIFPDKIRYNTSNNAVEHLEAATASITGATVEICKDDGTAYSPVTAGTTAPSSPSAGNYWLDTSGSKPVLKVYSGSAWTAVLTTYAKISKASSGLGSDFAAGDAVEITSGMDAIAGTHEIIAKGSDWVVISAVLSAGSTSNVTVKLERTVPDMDFVCELNNRLWGCSNANHEIYCCKLGDATNWHNYGTNAGDAYAATIGSAGDFTGCCAFGGCVLFWKEDILHKVMGTKPSNFQIIDAPMRGVQKGSEKSLCIVNEALVYKSRDGVMVYDGSSPMNVSQALGTARLYDACAGAEGDKYYISMRTEDNKWGLWVFNEAKGLWHREDETHAVAFAALNGQLYFLTSAGDLTAVRGRQETGATLEGDFDWWAETGDMLIETPTNKLQTRQLGSDMKYLSRLRIRSSVAQDSTLKIEIMYDSDGDWKCVFHRERCRKSSFTVPLVPGRCDHFRLRISGHGRSAVYAISKEFERGSDI